MAECQVIRMKHKRLCSGDLDRRICVFSRSLDAPGSTVDYGNTLVKKFSLWSGLKTTKGRQMFYGTNEEVAVTHVFYVRFRSCMTKQEWLRYKDENYDIIETENIDERGEWMALFCNVRGDYTEDLNDA